MKILWFTNIPSLYSEKTNGKSILGGWIPSLEKIFRENKYDLSLAFHYNTEKLRKDDYNGNDYYLIPGLKKSNKITRLKNRWLNSVIDEQEAISNYKKIIDDYKPDVVQIWGTEQFYGLIIPYLKVPHIVHIQGSLSGIYQKYYSGISKSELKKAITLKDWINRDPFYFSEKITLKIIEKEKKIFSDCKNYFGRTGFDRRIVKILAPGSNYFHCDEILRDPFYEKKWNQSFKTDKIRIISVARDSIYKGIETIIDTALLLEKQNIKYEWNIAGMDDKSQAIKILQKNRNFEINKLNINFLGFLDEMELIDIYNVSDLFIHTSHTDNSPNSLCEAMMLGLPIVSTNVGGIPSLLTDKKTGILVQDGDAISMAGAITEVIENYSNAVNMGNEAKKVAFARHDKNKIFNTVISTYEHLLKEHEPGI